MSSFSERVKDAVQHGIRRKYVPEVAANIERKIDEQMTGRGNRRNELERPDEPV